MRNDEITKSNNELFAELKKYPENTKEYQAIVGQIVKNNVRLVTMVVKKHLPTLKGSTLNDDLISEGYFALFKAVKWFDPEKGDKFSTFAWRCIDNEIITRLKKEQKHQYVSSLEDKIATNKNGDEKKLKDVLASPTNLEEDILEKNETQQQVTWIKKNLDQLKPLQKQVLTAKYLSGEASLNGIALAEKFNCTRQNISIVEQKAIANLKEMLPNESSFKGIDLTGTKKAAMKQELKNLILQELTPHQKKTMLCKFYATTKKTDEQVAQEIDSTKSSVTNCICVSCKKLCTLCDSVKDVKHLKNILEYRTAAPEKER